MTVASTQLYAGTVPASLTVLYTAPAGFRVIVKSVVVNNNHNAANNVSLYIYSAGGTLLSLLTYYMAADGSDGDTKIDLPWIVLNAGQTLRGASQSTTVYAAISGTQLGL